MFAVGHGVCFDSNSYTFVRNYCRVDPGRWDFAGRGYLAGLTGSCHTFANSAYFNRVMQNLVKVLHGMKILTVEEAKQQGIKPKPMCTELPQS